MAKFRLNPQGLFERRWSGSHPFRPRVSRRRRAATLLLLVVFCSIIGLYAYFTDSKRVRSMAEGYLSSVLGGNVKVGSATLSIFQGLRLDDVHVYVDKDKRADSDIFSAQTFKLNYDLPKLLTGRLEAAQILAIRPHVRLIQDVESQGWNYQRFGKREKKPATAPSGMPRPTILPEIILRDGEFENGEMRDGKYKRLGAMWFEGRLAPAGDDGNYHFTLQSQGRSSAVAGPDLAGFFVPATGNVHLRLRDFDFGPDLHGMLPEQVRGWLEQHQLTGRLSIHELTFSPGKGPEGKPTFKVRMEVNGVGLAVRSEEWRSREENAAVEELKSALAVPAGLGVGGESMLGRLTRFTNAPPVRLQDVHGIFEFTDSGGILIEEVTGSLEGNPFRIAGRIHGYSPDAETHLRFSSPEGVALALPHEPQYVRSLPVSIQEIYDRFKPEGNCRLDFRFDRPEAGAGLRVGGEIEVVDGRFQFDRFPYPLRNATGKIVISKREDGEDMLEIRDLRGYGIEGSANAKTSVVIKGTVGPFTRKAEVHITIEGRDVTSDATVIGAMPRETRDALKLFDAPGKGEYPKFHGNFLCTVRRDGGTNYKWDVETALDVDRASGRLVVFPYPMDDVSMRLRIRDDFLTIEDAAMKRGEATLALSGRVDWKKPPARSEGGAEGPAGEMPRVKIRPDLKVSARNVAIDRALVDALPPARAKWLRNAGLTGKADIDGRVVVDDRGEVGLDIGIALKDGKVLPGADGAYAVEGLEGRARLTPEQFEVFEMRGRRGQAAVSGRGVASWAGERPAFEFVGGAANLMLDGSLYKVLPPSARVAWDQVHPEGTVDAEVKYSGRTVAPQATTRPAADNSSAIASIAEGAAPAATTVPAAAPSLAGTKGGDDMVHSLELTLRPRELAVMPDAVPYRLTNLTGSATFAGGRVTLKDIAGKHGNATVTISGGGTVDAGGEWDLRVTGKQVAVDADLKKAAPQALGELVKSLELQGELNFDFTKLIVRPPGGAAEVPAATTHPQAAIPSPKSLASDVDFAVTLSVPNGAMSLGWPVTDVSGAAMLEGTLRGGRLADLSGKFAVASMKFGGRAASGIEGTLYKPTAQPALRISELRGTLAGGTLAGEVALAFPDDAPSQYNLRLDLINADVRQLAPDTEQRDIRGQLAASIAMEGAWADPSTRRGRGDLRVVGKEMYKVPVVMGLLQIANLSMPLSEPFSEATARYSVQGQALTFELVELRAPSMLMTGSGVMDFGTKRVRMTFTTDNPNWPKLPIINDLVVSARHELFQIKISGTIQEPKVSAGMLPTITTTVDEVIGGKK